MAGREEKSPRQTSYLSTAVPKMPDGYYSGDKPNPNLRAFVEGHLKERPYDPTTDDYDVPAFDQPIETTKATAIYNMHTYWSKKPHDAVRQYIRHYTKPGDLVLDPFCGSGGTALAALMEGRKAIAIDRSPAATFITKNYCTPVDVAELQAAFEELKKKVKPEIDWLYETRCDRCGGKATTAYTVYSQTFQCPRCLERVALFDCVKIEGQTTNGKPKKISVCPHCYARGIVEEINTREERFGAIPVLVSYLCENGCRPARHERRHNDADERKRGFFEQYDMAKLAEIDNGIIPHWYPKIAMIRGRETCVKRNLEAQGVNTVADLFTKRNLWALAAIRDGIGGLEDVGVANTMLFALNAILLNCSVMYRYRPSLKGGIMQGTYYLPQESQIISVWRSFEDKINDIRSVAGQIQLASGDVIVSTQSCADLQSMPAQSVDYVFTDPPYAEKVQYGELNYVWEAWLGFDTHWHAEEIIVNEVRGKTEKDWADAMRQAMAECYRVLKPGRWLSLCYHDTSAGTWTLIQDIMAEVGFVADKSESALFIDTGQKSYNQLTADKVNKRDLVINFRKPKPGESSIGVTITGTEDETTFGEKVRAIIRDFLAAHPGSTKDRVYDEVVSRLVRAGAMEPHNFDELLSHIAEEVREPVRKNLSENEPPNLFGTREITRWYLKETEEVVLDAAESAKEDAAADSVARFIEKWLKDHPWNEGVHYSDIFEHYVHAVRDKPRRALADWLLDYFYKTDEGTYRLPASDEERQLKAESRAKGTGRRIKRYVTYLEQGVPVPERERPNDATLVEWIRQCKKSGLYEQGKLLYERGGLNLDALPEDVQVGVEEDYQVCVRMLQRAGKEKELSKRRREKGQGNALF